MPEMSREIRWPDGSTRSRTAGFAYAAAVSHDKIRFAAQRVTEDGESLVVATEPERERP